MVKNISILEVEHLAHQLAKETMGWDEPIPDFHSRYPHRLESCLITPFQKFGGKDPYKGLVGKAAMLFYLMIKNHPFENGNKRIAMTTLMVFFYKNKKWMKVDEQKLYNFAKWVAGSDPDLRKETLDGLNKFIKIHIITL